jgi:tetratricopeptide (TPR) repeat protein
LNNKANALASLKEYNEALKCSDKAIGIDPDNANVWGTRGYVFEGLGKYEESLACSDKSIKIDPNNANVWNNKANVLS